MKTNLMLAVAVLSLFTSLAKAQTKSDVTLEFGPPIEAYSVSENIWMTPEFTEDGQVCSMRLYPKRISSTTNYLQDNLDSWELRKALDLLVAPQMRGQPTLIFGMINTGGGRKETTYNFEKVTFSFLTSVSMYMDPIKPAASRATERRSSRQAKAPPISNAPATNEMIVPSDAEIVTINWLGKPCRS